VEYLVSCKKNPKMQVFLFQHRKINNKYDVFLAVHKPIGPQLKNWLGAKILQTHYNGAKIDPTQTPEQLGMADGDTVRIKAQ
jgi:hypothetical protein